MTPRSPSSGGPPALARLTVRGYGLARPAPGEIPDQRAPLVHPRVVMTVHLGGFAAAAVYRSTNRAVEDFLPALDGHAD
jgi:hypothetical protein